MTWHYTAMEAESDLSPDLSRFDPFLEFEDDLSQRAVWMVEELPDYGLVNEGFEFDYMNVGYNRWCVVPWNWLGDAVVDLESHLKAMDAEQRQAFASSQSYDFHQYLFDAYFDLNVVDEPFSIRWYLLRAVTLYYKYANVNLPDDVDAVNSAFTIGVLLGEAQWKFQYEKLALQGQGGVEALVRAREQKASRQSATAESKAAKILEIWRRVAEERGSEAVRFDANAALHIIEVVEAENIRELMVKSTGRPISADALRKWLATLRKQGKLR